jgi:[ribosomal protein S5]-alanine N-acetyltransferase
MKDLKDILSSRVLLRSICAEDALLVVQWKSDPLVKTMALSHSTKIDIEGQKRDIESSISSEDQIYYVICLNKEKEPIGYIRVDLTDDERKYAWLRFALGTHRGQGYMKESLTVFISHLFANGIMRIDAEVYQSNIRSQRLLEKMGFTTEGRRREAHFNGQGYEDIVVYGLLKKEWTV